jgi:DNA-binding response OmpR family regulator
LENLKGSILVVDDDPSLLQLLIETLTDEHYFVVGASGGVEAISLINLVKYNLILIDLDLPDIDGCSVVNLIRDLTLQIPVIMMSGHHDGRHAAIKVDIEAYLAKPFQIPVLLQVIEECVLRSRPPERTLSLSRA